ncbi:MAG: T9SS type A sorting domain-containing protein [Ignavibacteria bacterium]
MKTKLFLVATIIFVQIMICGTAISQSLSWKKCSNIPSFTNPYDAYDDIAFINTLTGWVNHHSGKVYKTTNGGIDWILIFNDSSYYFSNKLSFLNELTGWSGLTNGLCKTTNGGVSWTKQNIPSMSGISFPGISVVNSNLVYVCGNSQGIPKIAKTTDNGTTWSVTSINLLLNGVYDIKFFNENIGLAAGYKNGNYLINSNGSILYTSNGGANWSNRYTTNAVGVNASKIFFNYDNSVGGVVIEGAVTPSVFLKTLDQGSTFSEIAFTNSSYISQAIGFKNSNIGWVGGSKLTNAPIYYTVNGGNSFDTVRWGRNITSFVFVNDTIAFASGYNIYKYSNGSDVGIGNNNEEIRSYYLSQNYPNPFNPSTKINYVLPNRGFVSLKVYDNNGRDIQTLLNENLNAGTYSVEFNGEGLSSGIYFYKIDVRSSSSSIGKFTDVKRMVLVK